MQALLLEAIHQPLRLADLPAPAPQPGEVVVRLEAAALNHRDVWVQQGRYPGIRLPVVLGSDGAGTVTATAGAPEWAGREVIINPALHWGADPRVPAAAFSILGMPRAGTFAQQVAVPAANLVAKPAHLTWEQAAALPLAGLTAYRALFSRAALQPGERLLITGIGGGVALAGLQFAVACGAAVYVTSGSDAKIGQARAMGAQGGANYTHPDWIQALKEQAGDFHVVLDGAGGSGFAGLLDLAAPGGRIVTYGGTRGTVNGVVPGRIFWKQLTLMGSTMGSEAEFRDMVAFVERHRLMPVVSRVFALAEGNAALAFLKESAQFGKIVLRLPRL